MRRIKSRRVATGFLGATNLAIDRHGRLFVTELFAGRVFDDPNRVIRARGHHMIQICSKDYGLGPPRTRYNNLDRRKGRIVNFDTPLLDRRNEEKVAVTVMPQDR